MTVLKIGKIPMNLVIIEVDLQGEALDLPGYYQCNETLSSPAPPSLFSSPGCGQSRHLALAESLSVSAGERVGRGPSPSYGRFECI